MDRFIAGSAVIAAKTQTNLKSNMDRFIASAYFIGMAAIVVFKIQYG